MQRRMSVPDVKGKDAGEKFGTALKAILSLTPEQAAEVRKHEPKKRVPKTPKASAR